MGQKKCLPYSYQLLLVLVLWWKRGGNNLGWAVIFAEGFRLGWPQWSHIITYMKAKYCAREAIWQEGRQGRAARGLYKNSAPRGARGRECAVRLLVHGVVGRGVQTWGRMWSRGEAAGWWSGGDAAQKTWWCPNRSPSPNPKPSPNPTQFSYGFMRVDEVWVGCGWADKKQKKSGIFPNQKNMNTWRG